MSWMRLLGDVNTTDQKVRWLFEVSKETWNELDDEAREVLRELTILQRQANIAYRVWVDENYQEHLDAEDREDAKKAHAVFQERLGELRREALNVGLIQCDTDKT